MKSDQKMKQILFDVAVTENDKILKKNIDEGKLTVFSENEFIFAYTCRGTIVNVECIRPMPKGTQKRYMESALNKLNEETGLEKYFVSEVEGKKFFNMSLLYVIQTEEDDKIKEEASYLTKYVKEQAQDSFNKLLPPAK